MISFITSIVRNGLALLPFRFRSWPSAPEPYDPVTLDTAQLIHPGDRKAIESVPVGDFTLKNLAMARAFGELFARRNSKGAKPDDHIDIPDSPASAFCYRPTEFKQNSPCLIYIHGGGMIAWAAKSNHDRCRELAELSGATIISVVYRLVPEHPFPAALLDCYDVLKWTQENAALLEISKDRISVMGHSAGGGLATALALYARDQGGPTIKAVIPVYPMIDHRTGTVDAPFDYPNTGEFIWTRRSNRTGWQLYRSDYAMNDHRLRYFSPSLADDLSDLPPFHIPTGSLDLFLPENRAFADALAAAGIPVELKVYDGAVHAFDMLSPNGVLAASFRADLEKAFARLI